MINTNPMRKRGNVIELTSLTRRVSAAYSLSKYLSHKYSGLGSDYTLIDRLLSSQFQNLQSRIEPCFIYFPPPAVCFAH
jgi:hypothetical protein